MVFGELTKSCPAVRPAVRMKQLGSHSRDFHGIFSILRIIVEKIEVSLKSEKNNCYFTRRLTELYDNKVLYSSYNEKFVIQNHR
jgi:hypothetical protein